MAELNYLRIAELLRGTATDIEQPSFRVSGAGRLCAERFWLRQHDQSEHRAIPASANPAIAAAFEKVRNGHELDRVLVDPVLYAKFIAAVRHAGVTEPEPLVNRRLQAFRKSSVYHIKLKRSTRDSGLVTEPFFYAAELGFVQLNYRREVSVDDVITEPQAGEEFVSLCKKIAPNGTAMLFKWATLQLRKMRYFTTKKAAKLLSRDPAEIEAQLESVGTLDRLSLKVVPPVKGVFSLTDMNKPQSYLFIGASPNLHNAVQPFRRAKPFKALVGSFWDASLENVCLRIGMVGTGLFGVSARDVSLRLIEDRQPLFNMPVRIPITGARLS